MRTGAWALTAALLLAGAGCERKAEAPAAPAAPAEVLPLSYSEKTADAEGELTLPAALQAHPVLHKRLYEEEIALIRKFVAEAKTERAAVGVPMPPYGLEVSWRLAAETPRLLSLVRDASEFTGGAHPNGGSTTLLWDKQAGREAPKSALFTASAPQQLERPLCDALKRVKAERGGVELTGETWACPKWNDVTLALQPGQGGKAGGVVALFSPYEVGPYAEGAYEVTLPAAVVREAVAPEFRGEFAG